MKYQTITGGLTAFALSAIVAVAAENTLGTTNAQNQTPGNQWLVDTSKLDGATIWDFHGNKLGELQQVLVDPESGRIRYGILEVDKAWNWNDPTTLLPTLRTGNKSKPDQAAAGTPGGSFIGHFLTARKCFGMQRRINVGRGVKATSLH